MTYKKTKKPKLSNSVFLNISKVEFEKLNVIKQQLERDTEKKISYNLIFRSFLKDVYGRYYISIKEKIDSGIALTYEEKIWEKMNQL